MPSLFWRHTIVAVVTVGLTAVYFQSLRPGFINPRLWKTTAKLKELFMSLWSRRLKGQQPGQPTLPDKTRNVILTDITLEILANSNVRLATLPESQVFVDFVFENEGEIFVKTFGPLSRESDLVWKLPGHLKVSGFGTYIMLIGYFHRGNEQDAVQLGYVVVDDFKVTSVNSRVWSRILRDKENEAIAKIMAQITSFSEENHGATGHIREGEYGTGKDVDFSSSALACEATGRFFEHRFQKTGTRDDIEIAVHSFQQALYLTPDGHLSEPLRHHNLGVALHRRFERFRVPDDLEEAIKSQRQAVLLTPNGHSSKPQRLNNLGNYLTSRFQRTGMLSDMEEAIVHQSLAVSLMPDGHSDKPSLLNNLGFSFFRRFEQSSVLTDLEKAIENQRQAVLLTRDGHPHKPLLLNNLGNSFFRRFQQTDVLSDLEEAIENQRQVVSLMPDKHSDKPSLLDNLGNSLLRQFERTGVLSGLEEAISNQRRAVLWTPDEHPSKLGRLNNLGNSFIRRFERTGLLADLEEAIEVQRQAVLLAPEGHLDKPTLINNLGTSFFRRFERTGVLSDLEEAIRNQRQAVLLTPDGHPDRAARLGNLGNSSSSRFQRTGDFNDMDEAIKNQSQAVSLTADGHPDKPSLLNNLGHSLLLRLQRTGDLSDLEGAIENQRKAVSLTPDGHPYKPAFLNNLGNSYRNRFASTGVLSDLEEAIKNQGEAVLLTPDGHPDKPRRFSSLGNSLHSRFEWTGVLSDLEEAIGNQHKALSLIPDGHPDTPSLFHNLGYSFFRRFERTGVLDDLEEAMRNYRQAVLLTPDGHRIKPIFLNSLGSTFFRRFEHTGALSDVEGAIEHHRQAASLTPDGDLGKPGQLNNLGNSFFRRFERTGALDDMEKAIENQLRAVILTPDGHPDKPGRFNNLGNSFRTRFERTGTLSDLKDAIENQRKAVLLTPDGHYSKPTTLYSLASSFQCLFANTRALPDLQAAILNFRSSATLNIGSPLIRFKSSRSWARLLVSIRDPYSALEAYRRAIHFLQQIAWIGDPITVRHSQLIEVDDLPREAAACALDAGRPDLALEWLEQGRSIVWNQSLSLHSSADDLHEAHPDLYAEFMLVSHQLQDAAIRDQGTRMSLDRRISLEEVTQHHHRLAEKWDSLVDSIRSLPGFSGFLLPKTISSLRLAAESGPVVTINVHRSRCDGLVLLQGKDEVHHVPLPGLSYADLERMQKSLKRDLATSSNFRDDRAGKPYRTRGSPLEMILSSVFSNVVRPILQSLDMTNINSDSSALPRIWWCPTGPLTFLPIHAAGIDTPLGRDEVSNYVISSYTPTVNALLQARVGNRRPFKKLVGIAMINSPPELCLNPLPNARVEIERIRTLFTKETYVQFRSLLNEEATREQVLTEMADSSWVHFACHASQDPKEPIRSSLWLHDGPLSITDLVSRRFENADLAFLSACETAVGDETKSDEAMHITAAMMGAGYRSIIGTMWSIPDVVAPILAGKVYEILLSGGEPDSEKAARALHEGMKELRKSGDYSWYSWVPFVHFGL